jgi:hypothetical protein
LNGQTRCDRAPIAIRESSSPTDSVGQQRGVLDRIADVLDTALRLLNSAQVLSLLELFLTCPHRPVYLDR